MNAFWKYFLFFVWVCYALSCGLLLFTRGFLLHRQVLKEKSSCSIRCDHNSRNILSDQEVNSCLSADSFQIGKIPCIDGQFRVVLVVIDALRYDFMVYQPDLKESEQLPFQNRLKVVNDLIISKPKNTRLFKFIADPPTTTLQRLLALTTGSLPTFIDAGSNFATTEVNEDNLIDQLFRSNKKTVMMGDDTWLRLYPFKFSRHYAYESFNVWDLDTVDNGVKKHLIPEIQKDDWSLLVAHFLGVDHCGHRYGPYHPEMKRKLTEMDGIIREVVDAIDNHTVLIVIGDHGMTATGDHGGASDDEVNAALFAYSNLGFLSSKTGSESVSQVDLVPTLATILGIPIPFSNLGALIPDLLPSTSTTRDDKFALYAAWSNVIQVINYLDQYVQSNNDLPTNVAKESHERLKKLDELLKSSHSVPALIENSGELIVSVRTMFVQIWAKFDGFAMTWGLVMFMLLLAMIYSIIQGLPFTHLASALSPTYLTFTYCSLVLMAVVSWFASQMQSKLSFDILLFVTTCACSLFYLMLLFVTNASSLSDRWSSLQWSQEWVDFLYRKTFIVTLLGMTSNSYIVEESSVLFFVLASVVFLLVFSFNLVREDRSAPTRGRHAGRGIHGWLKAQIHPIRVKLLGFAVLLFILVRVSQVFFRCREEQTWCQRAAINAEYGQELEEASSHNWHSLRMVFCIALWVIATRMWLQSCGNLTGYSIIVLLVGYVPIVIAVCSGIFWFLQGFLNDRKAQLVIPWRLHLLPLTVYGLIILTVLVLFWSPLCVFALPAVTPLSRSSITIRANESAIPQLFNQVRRMMENSDDPRQSANRKPIVYGLATSYSAAYLVIGVLFVLLMGMLLGTQLAPSAVLMGTCSILLVGLLSYVRYGRVVLPLQLFNVPWSAVLCWTLFAHYFFYATGHQATFPNIHWDAAMIGTGGNFAGKHVLPAILVIINTFGSYIFMALMLPLLMIGPVTMKFVFGNLTPPILEDSEMEMGEIIFFQREAWFYRGLLSLCAKYVLLLGLRVFACMMAATIHTRHLMTWKIFAPKLIFEGLAFLITLPCIALAFLLAARVSHCIQSLMNRLDPQTSEKSD